MPRPRYRIRFRKLDDLRLVGHHDLVRLWERLLRRADVKPAMSEGFHPRARVNFPSALAVGISGLDEVMELELSEERDPSDLAAALERHAPAGLSIAGIEPMGDGTRFSQPAAAGYEVPLPADQVAGVKARIEARRARGNACTSQENGGAASAAPAPGLETQSLEPWPDSIRSLDVVDGVLRMHLRLGEAGAVRPRDLLAALELSDLETQGFQITRTRVELGP
jgi:radical SAM-linked protein